MKKIVMTKEEYIEKLWRRIDEILTEEANCRAKLRSVIRELTLALK